MPAVRTRVFLLLAALAVGLPWEPGAAAAGSQPAPPPVPEVVPDNPGPHGYFEYGAGDGQTAYGAVTVENPSSTPATFDVYPTDASTALATGVIYSPSGSAPRDTGTWFHLADTRVGLQPGQSRSIGFIVTVPSNATPGDHIGGIAAENPSSVTSGAAGQARQAQGTREPLSTRVVVAVVIHVPGAAAVSYHLGNPAFAAAGNGRAIVEVPMDDTGSLLSKPYLTANIRACGSSQTLAMLSRQLDTFVPHTSIVYQWPLGRRLNAGCYTVTASLYSGTALLASVTSTAQPSAAGGGQRTGAGGAGAGFAPASGSGDPPDWIVALDSALLLSVGAAGATALLAERRKGVRQ